MIVDSYYGSFQLVKELHLKNWGILASCKSDRPSFLFSNHLHKNLEKGSFNEINNKHFSALTYYDKAKVNLITNLFVASKIIKSRIGDKTLPKGIYFYRKWLGGVDHFDRWLHLYLQHHRNIKWTQALLDGMLKMAVNNTHIIASNFGLTNDLRETTLSIVDHLSGNHSLKLASPTATSKEINCDTMHWPERLEEATRCVYCKQHKKDSKTTFKCSQCDVPLHIECMKLYHSQ